MESSIRRTLWGAFVALTVLVAIGLAATVVVLQVAKRQEYKIVHASEPLLDAAQSMDQAIVAMLGASRGYLLTQQTQFLQQYDDGVREFEKQSATATQLATSPRDLQLVSQLRRHFADIRGLIDRAIVLAREGNGGNANEFMLEAARIRRSTPDYAGILADEHRRSQSKQLDQMTGTRQGLTMLMVIGSIVIVGIAAYTVWRIERSLSGSIDRESRRTEAMISGMADGVMLIDGSGKTVFINKAATELLGKDQVGVPIDEHAAAYGLRNEYGEDVGTNELPAALSLSTGKSIQDVTMVIDRPDKQITVAMSATPLHDLGRVSGVVVTFR